MLASSKKTLRALLSSEETPENTVKLVFFLAQYSKAYNGYLADLVIYGQSQMTSEEVKEMYQWAARWARRLSRKKYL